MEFKYLAGKIALGSAFAKDYTDWAESMLEIGVESENIEILAGLSLDKEPDSEEVRHYFNKSIKDLGLELPIEENSILSYAKYICSEIIEENISPKDGLSILEGIYSKSDYEPIYSIWDGLSEDIWMVMDREACIFNTELTIDNIDQFILKAAKQFIKISEIKLPDNFFNLCACSKCGHVGEYILKRYDKAWLPEFVYRIIYKTRPAMCGTCAKCGEKFPLGMSDYEGRRKYLESVC